MREHKNKIYFFVIIFLSLSTIFVWRLVFAQHEGADVIFFDIGQGDSALISESNNVQILIDGGPSGAVMSKLGSAMPWGDNTIEIVIVTHPDKDHIAGLVDVFERYNIGTVIATMVPHSLAEYQEIKRLINQKNIPVVHIKAPQRIFLEQGSYLDIIYPFDVSNITEKDSTNAKSIVGRFIYGSTSVLFTGDLEIPQETELLFKQLNVSADILKVGHHGSKTSSGDDFLDAVNPIIAVISSGKNNRYGHPHEEAIQRILQKNIKIMRTDEQRDILLHTNGSTWNIVEK